MDFDSDINTRLTSLGYEMKTGDDDALALAEQKILWHILNNINEKPLNPALVTIADIPQGLYYAAVDMVCGEFLKTVTSNGAFADTSTSPGAVDAAVKSIQVGDTSVSFAVGDGAEQSTPSQKLAAYINYLLNGHEHELVTYGRLAW
jgi:hypothetical protein